MTRWNAYLVERRSRPEDVAYLGEWTLVSSPKTKDSAVRAARKLETAGDVVRVKERSSTGVYRTIPHAAAPAVRR